jgi:hypothetical protein
MSSDARSDASDTADADAELEPSADSDPKALEVTHGANAAGAADTAGGQQLPCQSRAHSCVLAMHRAKKKPCSTGPERVSMMKLRQSVRVASTHVLMPPGQRDLL